MKQHFLVAIIALAFPVLGLSAKTVEVTSPNGAIKVQISDKPLRMDVSQDGVQAYSMQDIDLKVDGKFLAGNASIGSVQKRQISETIRPYMSLKFSEIESVYTKALISLSGSKCSLEVRVMDNAVAYRFVTNIKGQIEVDQENFTFVPADGFIAHRQTTRSFKTSFEEEYRHETLDQWRASERNLSSIPLLLSAAAPAAHPTATPVTQLLLGEADVDDYPKTFLQATAKGIQAIMPKAPLKWEPKGDRSETILEEAPYIAKTSGTRTFPWRYVVCTDTKGIIEQTLTLQLSRKSALTDESWIKYGQMSWEWWNGAVPYGPDVDFKAGNNFETYAYFADFAAKYGVEYILLDEGWAKNTFTPFEGKPDLRLHDLIDYAGKKGVGVVLWLPWLAVENNFDTLFETYEKWGVKGVKIDFMDHADQWMVNYYKRVVAKAAEHHLIVDFHGAFTPAGLEYEYPNLVSYEGIRGLEYMRDCTPNNYIFHPFIRNAVGPADFTPGAMLNYQPWCYNGERPSPGSMSTRAGQMALFVVLESGVQMLADCPTRYYQNDDCTRFITSVPTTWDETRCLSAEVGEYVVVAKRKGDKWFIGGITNSHDRALTMDLNFLGNGAYQLVAFKDGSNANIQAMHYTKEHKIVDKTSQLDINMTHNGGFAAVLTPAQLPASAVCQSSATAHNQAAQGQTAPKPGPLTSYVNPLLGTETLWDEEELQYERHRPTRTWGGEVFPGSSVPFAMVQVSPMTMYHAGAGYQYEDSTIVGFTHTSKGHWNLQHLPILPVKGRFVSPDNFATTFSHDNESAHPGYYQVYLDRYGVNVELTSTLRCAFHHYTYDDDEAPKAILFDITHANNPVRTYSLYQVSDHAFAGSQFADGKIYFYGVSDQPIKDVEFRQGRKNNVGIMTLQDTDCKEVNLRIGFSFVSIENAKQNLEAEMLGKSFDEIHSAAIDTWEDLLCHIKVEGGTERQKGLFYSTLYRSFLWPVLRSDVNGEYLDANGEIVNNGFRYYTDPSFWDDHRNKLILMAMVTPDVATDVIKSITDRGEKRGGYMPTFFHGDHASTFVAGCWNRGIRDFDLERAYKLLLNNATKPGRGGRPYLDEYLAQGWIAEKDTVNVTTDDEYKAAVTKTLEYAYDDYATALIAKELGDKANYKTLMRRSQNYKNVFDPSTGFYRGRIADGSFIEDFRPGYPYFAYQFREATAWQSIFYAPHDPYGMVKLYPSAAAIDKMADDLFSIPWGRYEAANFTGFIGQYCHGNQPGHSQPYIYYFIDKQEKSQAIINQIMDTLYDMGHHHLAYPGMDDAGEMSAWYVMNAIGLYTYSPADPEYIVTVPLFDKVTFTYGDGSSFTVNRVGSSNKITKITVGGKALDGWFVKDSQLRSNQTLEIITE